MMRTLFCLFILLMLYALPLFAQKKSLLATPYHTEIRKGTIADFLNDINTRSGIVIEWASNTVDSEKVIAPAASTTVGGLLSIVLRGQKVRLLEKNNKIILAPSPTIIDAAALAPVYTVYGYVKDAVSREPLADATVWEPSAQKGLYTNPFGYFSLSLPEGQHRLEISYVGYEPLSVNLSLTGDTRLDPELSLKAESVVMKPVTIPAGEIIQKSLADRINEGEWGSSNKFLGESDPFRSAYMLPGVLNVPSPTGGLLVRGGAPGDNLFLMDGVQVFNPTHMMGALSIVNQTSLKSMQFYKSDFPSKFGGATSSVMEVYTRDGNMTNWEGELNAGTMAGAVTIEGPLIKEKTAIMASLRHSYQSPLYSLFQKEVKPNFYDGHFKITHLLNKRNKLMLKVYSGKDEVRQTGDDIENLSKWGNLTGSLGWNHLLGSKSFVHTSVNYSSYKNLGVFQFSIYDDDDDDDDNDGDPDETDTLLETGSIGNLSLTEMYSAKTEAEIYLSNQLKINGGAEWAHTTIQPFETKFSGEIDDDETSYQSFTPLPYDELSAYAEAEWKQGGLFLRAGVHYSYYQFKTYQYHSVQPRFLMTYQVLPRHKLFASYNRMTQYLHLVTNPYLGQNADLWVPSSQKLLPEESETFDVGWTWKPSGYSLTLEGYYKILAHVTNYAEGKSYLVNSESWEENVTTGRGWAYGLEVLAQKSAGRLTLLGSYTLAWSWRQFAGLHGGKKFPYKYDRRHAAQAGAAYKLSRHFKVSANWTFSTGDAYALPDHVYPDFDGAQGIVRPDDPLADYRFIYHSGQGPFYRTSVYQRLDAAISYFSDAAQKEGFTVTAGVYDAFNSPDQYVYEVRGSTQTNNRVVENKLQTFGLAPYVSVNFKF